MDLQSLLSFKVAFEMFRHILNVDFENKNKYILITGSAGNIGSKLSFVFLEKGANLILIDNNRSAQKNI